MWRRRLGRWVLSVCLILNANPVATHTLLFLTEEETPLYQAWSRDPHRSPTLFFTLARPSADVTLQGFLSLDRPEWPPIPARKTQALDSLADLCHRERAQVVVALGDEAARMILRACQLPTLLVGMTRQQLAPLLADARREPVSAIYREADPSLDLRLARALLPNARTVGVLVPTPEPAWLTPLRVEGRRLAFALDEIAVTDDLDAVRMLRPRLTGLDAVLLPPDPNIVNEWSLKPLLLMTVRQGVPVLGGSTARYVEAGVLAAVVADERRMPEQMRALIAELAQGRTPHPTYPASVRVAINRTVAETLGVSAEAIHRAWSLFSTP